MEIRKKTFSDSQKVKITVSKKTKNFIKKFQKDMQKELDKQKRKKGGIYYSFIQAGDDLVDLLKKI